MKKLLAFHLSFILIAQMPASTAFAAFEEQGAGARAPGMAGAYTAVADDADAIGYNPAGLVQLNEGQVSTQYGQLTKGLDDGSSLGSTYVGYAYPLVRGFKTIGFAYNNFRADNLFNERTLTASYGQRLKMDPFNWGAIWSLGGNLKQLHREFEADRFTENALNDAGAASNSKDPVFGSGYSKDSYAIDLGGLVQFGRQYQYTLGATAINVNRPDVSLGGDGDKVPMLTKVALGYRPKWGTLTAESRRTKRLEGITDSDVLIGVERNVPFANLGAMVLRGGYATGSRGYRAMTLGLSYLYARFRLDYAFDFPVEQLAKTQGTHRLGLAFKLGAGRDAQLAKDYSSADLVAAFIYDSLTTHILLTRLSLARSLTPEQKEQFMLLLMRKFTLDDPGLKDVGNELKDLIRRAAVETLEWPQLKYALAKGASEDDKSKVFDALEMLARGDNRGALVRLALLPNSLQKTDRIEGIALMALSGLAAQAYRDKQLDACIDSVRRMLEILPLDEVVQRGYRQLLALRSEIFVANEPVTQDMTVREPLPEAPQSLVAPRPVMEQSTPKSTVSDFETLVRAYGNSLGYYLTRKAAGASADELTSLLRQMKATYGGSKLNMSLVDRELLELMQPSPKPVPAPAKKPAVESKPTSIAKVRPTPKKTIAEPAKPAAVSSSPIIWTDPEMQRAWDYYRDAVAREISDHERVELLESMLRRFGERGAARINKELERIQKRLE